MGLVPPHWFVQRQGKVEPAGADTFRLTAPNMTEAILSLRQGEAGRWAAAVRAAPDGPDVAVTPFEFARPEEAWGAGFELYRVTFVV